MPVAGPSRRIVRRREPSPDAIEDEASRVASQETVEDDDMEDEDDRPRRKALKVKKEKGAFEKIENPEEILANLGNQPLDRAALMKVGGVALDWAQIRKGPFSYTFNLIADVAPSFAEFAEGEQGEQSLADLEATMKRLIDTENELSVHETVLNELREKIALGEEVSNVVERYQTGVQEKMAEYKKRTARQKYGKHDQYNKYRQAVFEVQHPDTAMPPVTEFLPREAGDDSDDDDDIQVGGVTQDYKCPLTLTILVDPLTSSVCGHSFSANAIREYMAGKRSVQCPASGCHKMLALADLKPDQELAKKARDAARRERARETSDDSEDDEVIE
ncbi:unnamed protein product [Somion occarium]|uniref:SP-RING-type domain-containing protein n=1 Tax=Somion occarium TaxID=3059160 RepID=A0ABP1DZK0_9APHY